MADLIFRGVKNPANCSECYFWAICPCLADFDDYSAILDAFHDGNLVRHEECPVSPLPKGHGKIIDGDALWENMTVEQSEAFQKGLAGTIELFEMLEAATPIVPAEGGTDNG